MAHTDGILNLFGEIEIDDVVDFCGAEADAAGVEDSVGAAVEVDACRGCEIGAMFWGGGGTYLLFLGGSR